jgi:hypothetical protein
LCGVVVVSGVELFGLLVSGVDDCDGLLVLLGFVEFMSELLELGFALDGEVEFMSELEFEDDDGEVEFISELELEDGASVE